MEEVDKLVVSLELNLKKFDQSLTDARNKLKSFANDIGVSLSTSVNVANNNIVNNINNTTNKINNSLTNNLKNIANTTNKLTNNVSNNLKVTLNKVDTTINRASANIKNTMVKIEGDVNNSATKVAGSFGKMFAGGAVVAGIYAMFKLIKKGIDLTKESFEKDLKIRFTSSISKSGTEDLQKLQNSYALVGGSKEQVGSDAFEIRNRILTAMGNGGDISLFSGLGMLGVNPYGKGGHILSGTDLLIEEMKGAIALGKKSEMAQSVAMQRNGFSESMRALVADPKRFEELLKKGALPATIDSKDVVDKNAKAMEDWITSANALNATQDKLASNLATLTAVITNAITKISTFFQHPLDSLSGLPTPEDLQKTFADNPPPNPIFKKGIGFWNGIEKDIQSVWTGIIGTESSFGSNTVRDTNKLGEIKADTSYGMAQITPQRAVDVIKAKENRTVSLKQAYDLIKNQKYANELSAWEISRLSNKYGGNIAEIANDWHSGRQYDKSYNSYVKSIVSNMPLSAMTNYQQRGDINSNQSSTINIANLHVQSDNPDSMFNKIKNKYNVKNKNTSATFAGAFAR